MRRFAVRVSVAVVVLLSLVSALALGGQLAAQDAATPEPMAQGAATEDHPLVGTWLADTDTEDESNGLELFTFHPDGSYISVEPEGYGTSLGIWEASGPTTANVTILAESDAVGADTGTLTIRAAFEVSEDGSSFTASYTFEFIGPDGTSTGEAGPGMTSGTRLEVEAPGTPVMSLDELFGLFEGTPEATPTS
jgi:hypothetical protein